MSSVVTGTSLVVPGRTTPGQRTINGTRMPPSYTNPFPARSGRFDVGAPSAVDRPPLSLVNTTSVFSCWPAFATAASTVATVSSISRIMPAYTG